MKSPDGQQLQLSFDVPIKPVIKAAFDPYWDELDTEPVIGTKQIDSVREQISFDVPPYKSVREQVNSDTAPEHNYPELQVTCNTCHSSTHWVEKYWVKRRGDKHEYYRYCWMEARKIYRAHISGRAGSIGANNRKEIVESAIIDGQSPQEIKQVIRGFGIRD